ELPVEVRAAKLDLRSTRPAVTPSGPFSREALGDGGHVDATTGFDFRRKSCTGEPLHQHSSRPTLEGQAPLSLDRARGLPDQHDAVVGVAAEDGRRPSQIAGIDASGAAQDVAVHTGELQVVSHWPNGVPTLQVFAPRFRSPNR